MIKKAILTGGGHATRLRPITSTINKHLIELAGKPMIFHAIDKVVQCGVEEIFINTNPGEQELAQAVGDGSRWGVKITFFEQQGGPQGIAHVVNQAKKFIGSDPFMFYLSDNIVLSDLNKLVHKFDQDKCDCLLTLSKVKDPERFGVPYFDKDGKLINVVEKPSDPPNNLAVTGIYLYGADVFFEAFDNIERSDRGEYEISDIHSYLLSQEKKVVAEEITGWWKDTGKPDDLIAANSLLIDELPKDFFQIEAGDMSDSAKLEGKIFIGKDCVIGDNVKINGPVIIGEKCQLDNCTIGPHVSIGRKCILSDLQISNSILFNYCSIQLDKTIDCSIIGKGVKISKKSDSTQFIIGDNSIINI